MTAENENIVEDTTVNENTAAENEETASNVEPTMAQEDVSVEDNAEDAADSTDEDTAQADSEAEAGVENDKEEASGKGFMGKLGRRDKKALEKKDEQIAQLTDQWRRTMAEFDNYRKRTDKEKATMYGMGVKDVVEKILPVVDNFERGLAHVAEDQMEDTFVQGMQAIYKQFITTLEALDVKAIEAVGQPFDPNFHNAVMHVEDDSLGENIVAEEFQKGYLYKDIVIRHSMVKVAN